MKNERRHTGSIFGIFVKQGGTEEECLILYAELPNFQIKNGQSSIIKYWRK